MTADGWEYTLPNNSSKFRAAEFVTDAHTTTFKLRRPKASTAPPDVKSDQARRELVGRWAATRHAYPSDNRLGTVDRSGGDVEITPEFLLVQRAGTEGKLVWVAAEYTLDSTKNPKWIDLKFAGKSDGDAYGIYELAGDTLRISYRLGVPRVFRTLEFKAGLEEALTGDDDKAFPNKPACALLELKRAKTP